MSLNSEKVKHIAHLARLALDEDDVARYASELSGILDLVDQLEQADTDQVIPMAHPLNVSARLRPDEVTEPDRRETFQQVAPAVEDGLYLVPKVIE